MSADVLTIRDRNAPNDRAQTARIRAKAEQELLRVQQAAERIRQMTKIYIERQDGNVQ